MVDVEQVTLTNAIKDQIVLNARLAKLVDNRSLAVVNNSIGSETFDQAVAVARTCCRNLMAESFGYLNAEAASTRRASVLRALSLMKSVRGQLLTMKMF